MKTTIKAAAKKTLNIVARRTVAEAMRGKPGRPSNAEKAARAAKEAKAAERLKAKEAAAKAAAKADKKAPKAAAKKEDKKAAPASNFNIKAFKKAIATAFKKDKDISHAVAVVAMYKENRKLLKDALPKHAVNAFEKALANKKDESFIAKAVQSAQKHLVEKDFTM